MLSVLVTAGGTRERIDRVRSVTNHSTGRLGSLIGSAFYRYGANVVYLHGQGAFRPKITPDAAGTCETIEIINVAQLQETLEELLAKRSFDCIIHAMAVSDYSPYAAMAMDVLGKTIDEHVFDSTYQGMQTVLWFQGRKMGKISSDSEEMIIAMRRTPKMIDLIRELQPNAVLVGFKLLVGEAEYVLIEAAMEQIKNSGCDYVLANDLATISGDKHPAVMLDKNGGIQRAETKQEIAALILKTIIEERK